MIRPPEPLPANVTHLTDMGFPQAVVRNALLLNRDDVSSALDWLLQHGQEEGAGEALSQEQLRRVGFGGCSVQMCITKQKVKGQE